MLVLHIGWAIGVSTESGHFRPKPRSGEQGRGTLEPMDVLAIAALISHRSDLFSLGWSSHRLRKAVANGEMVCLYPGWFATSTAWQAWFPEERCVAQAIAVARAGHVGDDAVSHVTAGAMLGWPLYGVRPQRTHISGPTRDGNTRGRSLAHHRRPAVTDTIEIAGIRVTNPIRTASDLLGYLPRDAAVAVADAALREVAWDAVSHQYDQTRADAWRSEILASPALQKGQRGVAQARWVTHFADGRAQLPGESVSRLRLHQLGFAPPRLQVPIALSSGRFAYVDFGLDDIDAWGEFDGEGKYTDAAMLRAASTAQALVAEKWREDEIRAITGRRIVRWGMSHIRSPQTLGTRLAQFNASAPLTSRRVTSIGDESRPRRT